MTNTLYGPKLQELAHRDESWRTSVVGEAVITTVAHATKAYLCSKTNFAFTYSIGEERLRTHTIMCAIETELRKLFGHANVFIDVDPNYWLGVVIRVRLTE